MVGTSGNFCPCCGFPLKATSERPETAEIYASPGMRLVSMRSSGRHEAVSCTLTLYQVLDLLGEDELPEAVR